eukprot:gene3365-3690_t
MALSSGISATNCSRFDVLPAFSYSLTEGYVPSSEYHNNSQTYYDALKAQQSAGYLCRRDESVFIDSHFSSPDHQVLPVFHAQRFLSLYNNSRILILGDSLGRQHFTELCAALSPHRTTCPSQTNNCCATVFIQCFGNTTVIYKSDRFLRSFYKSNDLAKCGYPLERFQLTIIAAGHWFKPYHPPLSQDPSPLSYLELVYTLRERLRETLVAARSALQLANPSMQVVWRMIAHVGMCSEWDLFPSLFNYLPDAHNATFQKQVYKNGLFWSNLTLEAPWVVHYNRVIEELKGIHCQDLLLDTYELSHVYHKYFPPRGVKVHSDCVHNCMGGLPRGEIWLLQTLLEGRVAQKW